MDSKQELIDTVDASKVPQAIKDLIKTSIESAYRLGYQAGLMHSTEVLKTVVPPFSRKEMA